MANSTTSTAVSTARSKLKLGVPSLAPPSAKKQPWDGLLMGDPGSDYDQHEARLSIVDYMLCLGRDRGVNPKMANWRDNAVFDDGSETASPTTKTEGYADMHHERSSEGSLASVKSEESDTEVNWVWNDPNKAWGNEDGGWPKPGTTKKENEFNEYGLWYGKPWEVER